MPARTNEQEVCAVIFQCVCCIISDMYFPLLILILFGCCHFTVVLNRCVWVFFLKCQHFFGSCAKVNIRASIHFGGGHLFFLSIFHKNRRPFFNRLSVFSIFHFFKSW